MVRKLVMRLAYLNFRHVTTSAANLADLAQFRFSTRPRRMARPAAIVVVSHRLHRIGMRIVASRTADARIRGVVTLAVRQPVRLKAHVRDVVRPLRRNLRPGAVALAAKVGNFFRAKTRQMTRRHLRRTSAPDARQMFFRIFVAALAVDSRR